jgi:SAM-dependent methyltransferase
VTDPNRQDRAWSRHAADYDEIFLNPFRPGVHNPLIRALEAVDDAGSKAAIDLGCGTGPLLPLLEPRFGRVLALDFAPGMIKQARARLGRKAGKVEWLNRPMHDLADLEGQLDVAVAVNSIVMPDTREIDRTMVAIRRALKPGGLFLGVVPSIDAIHYSTMLLADRALDEGRTPEEAERLAAAGAEHHLFEFAFGRFTFRGLHQKFWQPFELEYRLRKAGFGEIGLEKLLYPWDEDIAGGAQFADQPPSWDWTFRALG